MTSPARVKEIYGFDFPEDLHRVWELASAYSPKNPLSAFSAIEMRLIGPFEALAGRFEGASRRYSALLHWRYRDDPPEFFTAISGGVDGLHFGYWFDDGPDQPWVASYYSNDGYEFSVCGRTLFDAIRQQLEASVVGVEENIEYDPGEAEFYRNQLREIENLRVALLKFATGEREERGEAYASHERRSAAARKRLVAADTFGGMGVVGPPALPLAVDAGKESLLHGDWERVVAAATASQSPTRQLQVGRDLFILAGTSPDKRRAAYALLETAYQALGRDLQLRALQAHAKHRDLPSVDILDIRDDEFHSVEEALLDPQKAVILNLTYQRRGSLPPAIGQLQKLKHLRLGVNELADLPLEVAQLTQLETLWVPRNPFRKVPTVVCRLRSLVMLSMDGCDLSDLPPEIGELSKLRFLYLNDNHLTRVPDELAHLKALEQLNATGNSFPAEEKERIRRILPNTKVRL